jgi:hypothetical protein
MKIFTQVAINLLEMIGKGLWGFKPNLMRHIVEQHGAVSALSWFVQNMPTYKKTLKEWGAIRTHLLTAVISVLNGCPYCTYGHAYALQLHYLKDKGHLMPVDEHEIVAWHTLSEAEAIDRFRSLIKSSGLLPELQVFERMLLLRQGIEQAIIREDHKILHLIEMFSFLNRCGITGKTSPDQAHDPINKDAALCCEYQRLRNKSQP